MEDKIREQSFDQPFTVDQCKRCNGTIVITAKGKIDHKCNK